LIRRDASGIKFAFMVNPYFSRDEEINDEENLDNFSPCSDRGPSLSNKFPGAYALAPGGQ
jgi:hypothetical protein